ncbi:MAG: M56/M15 family metallopeptidase [Armatimonadota bacterium]
MNFTTTSLPLEAQNFGLFLLDITLRATLLLALTAVAAALSARASAAWRHLVWMLGLITVLGLPLLSGVLPPLTVALPKTAPLPEISRTAAQPPASALSRSDAQTSTKDALDPVTAAASTIAPDVASDTEKVSAVSAVSAVSSVSAASSVDSLRFAVSPALFILWLAGATFVLAQWLAGSVGLRRIFRATAEVPVTGSGKVAAAYRAAESSLPGRTRPVTIRLATRPDVVRTPLTWGWRHPIIAFPSDAGEWTDERLQAALLHELAHVRRRDWPLQRLAHAVCALFWFHPLVWLAARAARAESEKASDDLVLAAGLPATVYADHLLHAARSLRDASRRDRFAPGSGAVAMVSPRMSGVEARLRAVLALKRSRCPVNFRRFTVTLLAALLLALPVAALHPIAAPQDTHGATDPSNSSGVLVQKVEALTQYISKDSLRAVYTTKDGKEGREVEFDRAAREKAPARVASGYKTTLSNGFGVEVVGLIRLAQSDGYWQYAGPGAWRKPDGAPLGQSLLPRTQIQSGMSPSQTGGIAPVLVITRFTPPQKGPRYGFSTIQEPLGIAQDQEYSWIIPSGDTYGPKGTTVNSYSYPLFPRNARTFAFRAGVATGPWTVQAVKRIAFTRKSLGKIGSDPNFPLDAIIKLDDRPTVEYTDPSGGWHHDPFLADGKRLGAEDRRIVAVDAKGKTFPIETHSMSGGLRQFGVPLLGLGFSPSANPTSPFRPASDVPLATIRELRLETRPFERVEFRNIALPPQPPTAQTASADTPTQSTGTVTVVIDAGHGGADSGATAKDAKEKEITLAVARQVQKELTAAGIRVVMTRTDDTYKPIAARGEVAAQEKAMCLVSIHCEQTTPTGSVQYHDNSASGKQLAADIARQNALAFGPASGKTASDTVRFVNGYGILRKSSLVSAAVLVHCPAVAKMASLEAQSRAARAIAAGIRDYVKATAEGQGN